MVRSWVIVGAHCDVVDVALEDRFRILGALEDPEAAEHLDLGGNQPD
ncbi:MAG TPA: hypothetical protein VFR23_05925 [Jiangellaceae bacterium]|nr:hypothetical protein [Jiangellaceae bacterium]